MARISFTPQLRRLTTTPELETQAAALHGALEDASACKPRLRGYVLGFWRSTDNAASWHEVKEPVSSFGFAVAVHPQYADTAWVLPAIKDEGRVRVDGALVVNRTRDGGKSFETLRTGLPQHDTYDLVYGHGLDVAANGRSLLMGSTTGGLWASSDAGDSWQTVSLNLPPIAAVRFG